MTAGIHGTDQAVAGLGGRQTKGHGSNVANPHFAALDTEVASLDSEVTTAQADIDELQLDDTVVVLTPGAAVSYDASLGHVATLTMDASATTTITITGLVSGESCTVVATQNSAGSKALVFDSTFFAGGTEPTQTAGANAVDIYTILKIGTQLYGFVAGQDLKT
jgi:hypothetical protein